MDCCDIKAESGLDFRAYKDNQTLWVHLSAEALEPAEIMFQLVRKEGDRVSSEEVVMTHDTLGEVITLLSKFYGEKYGE